jgi:hypothetical protein
MMFAVVIAQTAARFGQNWTDNIYILLEFQLSETDDRLEHMV